MEKNIQFVIKRDQSQVKFNKIRIQNAIFSAAQAVGGDDEVRSKYLTELVIDKLNQRFNIKEEANQPPNVEDIQDVVEQILISQNHIRTAKAYIKYRDQHTQLREDKKKDLLAKIGLHEATITTNGKKELFDMSKVISELGHYSYDLPKIDSEALVKEAVSNLYEGITITELEKSLINAARVKIELNVQYSYLAARLVLKSLYKKVLGESFSNDQIGLKKAYRKSFNEYIKVGINGGILDNRLLNFDLKKISGAILPNRDLLFQFRGLESVKERYLLKIKNKDIIELPQYMWMRVAMGLAINEEQKEEKAIEFYNVISEMLYIPSTPTLFNAGTNHPQLSSCFLNTVGDSLKSIFKSYSDDAMLSKYAGGLGTDWTNVRSLGSRIEGTNGVSQGVIPFLKIYNDVALAVNQGGKRKGAMCAYLELWHGDILEFIEAKKNTGDERRRLHDCHSAVWIPDLFMKKLENNEDWALFSPSEVPDLHDLYGKKFEERYEYYLKQNLSSMKLIPAQSLWRKLLTMTFETGHPWLTFKDACNLRNPQKHQGVIHNSNLCTEITLNNSKDETAVCNLGSINLANFVNDRIVDYKNLEQTIKTAIRMLDNVIDLNYYPTKETKQSNMKHRPIGLGVMGYQDALFKLNIPFDTEEHINQADELLERISYYAYLASAELAVERGAYETFKGSLWEQGIFPYDTLHILEKERGIPILLDRNYQLNNWDELKLRVKKHGLRNSNCLAIAPTATISNIAGVTPSIEPIFRNIYVKENTDGSFVVSNQYLISELDNLGLWNEEMVRKIKLANGSIQKINEIPPAIKRKYKETFEIDPKWLVKAAARRGKWIDQSQSLNIFISNASGKEISDVYKLAWHSGLKSTYYLRSQSASQVSKTIYGNEERGANYNPEENIKNETSVVVNSYMISTNQIAKGDAIANTDETNSQIQAQKSQAIKGSDIKLCAIDDKDDCEACQ